MICWQLFRSLFEYFTTYAWVAADPDVRAAQWLKYDYQYRVRLDNNFREFGETLMGASERQEIEAALPGVVAMPDLFTRAREVDDAWAESLAELDDYLPDQNRLFGRLYPLIYRNGSQFIHPSSHIVDRFVSRRDEQHLMVGLEQALGRDLELIGTGIVAIGLVIAITATPTFAISIDEIRWALTP